MMTKGNIIIILSLVVINFMFANSLNLNFIDFISLKKNYTDLDALPHSVCVKAASVASNYASCGCPFISQGDNCGCGGNGGLDSGGLIYVSYVQATYTGIPKLPAAQFSQGFNCFAGSSTTSTSSSSSSSSSQSSGTTTPSSGSSSTGTSSSSTSQSGSSGSTSNTPSDSTSASGNNGDTGDITQSSGSTASAASSSTDSTGGSTGDSTSATSATSADSTGDDSSTSDGSTGGIDTGTSSSTGTSGSGSSGSSSGNQEALANVPACSPQNTQGCTIGDLFFYTVPGETLITHVVMFVGGGNVAECGPNSNQICHIIPASSVTASSLTYKGCRSFCSKN